MQSPTLGIVHPFWTANAQAEPTCGGVARWWPSLYRRVEVHERDEQGRGRVIEAETKGFLPYVLRWQFRIAAAERPHTFTIEAWGDYFRT